MLKIIFTSAHIEWNSERNEFNFIEIQSMKIFRKKNSEVVKQRSEKFQNVYFESTCDQCTAMEFLMKDFFKQNISSSLNFKFFFIHSMTKKFSIIDEHNAHNCHNLVLIYFFSAQSVNKFFFAGCQNTTNNFPVEIKFYMAINLHWHRKKNIILVDCTIISYFTVHFLHQILFLITLSGYLHWHSALTSKSSIFYFIFFWWTH